MKLFRLKRSLVLPISMDEAWSFFFNPQNLGKITPPKMNLMPTHPLPAVMHPGQVIAYRVRIGLGISVNWVTEITHVDAPHFFLDEQRFGPYKFWHHLHRFAPHARGVLVEDIVHYGLYGGILARGIHAALVRPQLEAIFDYRKRVLDDLFV